jgi:hypothetical protein
VSEIGCAPYFASFSHYFAFFATGNNFSQVCTGQLRLGLFFSLLKILARVSLLPTPTYLHTVPLPTYTPSCTHLLFLPFPSRFRLCLCVYVCVLCWAIYLYIIHSIMLRPSAHIVPCYVNVLGNVTSADAMRYVNTMLADLPSCYVNTMLGQCWPNIVMSMVLISYINSIVLPLYYSLAAQFNSTV